MGKVVCLICGKEFKQLSSHIKVHNISINQYRELFPNAKTISDELHNKRSNSASGENNSFFGREHTEESKDKNRNTKNEFYLTDRGKKVREKLREDHTGIKASEATLKKMSSSHLKFYQTEEGVEFREQKSEKWQGKKNINSGGLSDEHRMHLSEAKLLLFQTEKGKKLAEEHSKRMKGRRTWNFGETKETDERVKGYGESLKFFYQSEEGKECIEVIKRKDREAHLGKKYGVETSKKHSVAMLRNWRDEVFAKNMFKARNVRPNKGESLLDTFLQEILPHSYKYVGDWKLFIYGKCPDFVSINVVNKDNSLVYGKKLIEYYGDYWHKGDDEGHRIFYFRLFGYETLIIWEHEMKDLEKLRQRILDFHNLV